METWQRELAHSIRTVEQLERLLPLKNTETIRRVVKNMRMAITPHTAKLIDFSNPRDPLLLMAVPQERELRVTREELRDPIGDEAKSPIPFLTHRYPDRVLVYATFACAHCCRFCFRRFKTGSATPGPSDQDWARIVAYLRAHVEVDEVILTGGDPWTLTDQNLSGFLKKLRMVESVSRIRFHTRVPVNLPSRVTPAFVEMLKQFQTSDRPIYVVTHFNHPREIADANMQAIARLVDAGIVVRNQSVLLRCVNDDMETLRALFKRLTDIRVVPYYLHQLDLARGTGHFRAPISRGIKLMRALQGHVTGIALPRFMLDLPGGLGKVPLSYDYLRRITDGSYEAESPFGEHAAYHEPAAL